MAKKYGKIIDFDMSRFPLSKIEEAHIYLYKIKVVKDKRRKGIGSQFMKDLCAYADFEKIPIQLTPNPLDDEINQKRLITFYKRFKFKKIRGVEVMRRAHEKNRIKSVKAELL